MAYGEIMFFKRVNGKSQPIRRVIVFALKNNEIRKVLLIVPPVTLRKYKRIFNVNYPMGLGYTAAVLKRASYEVVVLDALVENIEQQTPIERRKNHSRLGMTCDEIKEFVIKCDPDCVGVTSMFTSQFDNTVLVCNIAKEVNPDIPVIIGGAHATADVANCINEKSIDFVVSGEGEEVIVPLLEAISKNRSLDDIPNISYIDSNGNKVVKPVTIYSDVNKLPFPNRELFPMEKYLSARERHGKELTEGIRSASILTSRGCPFNCNFCSASDVFGKKLRVRAAQSVTDEIDELISKYKVNDIYLSDDQFLADRKRVLDILDQIISRNYGISFDAPNGLSPWLLTEEIIKKMKQAGFCQIHMAVESGNEWVLKNIVHKPVKLDRLPETVALAKKYGLRVSAFLVVGNVGENAIETFEQMKDSFTLMRKLGIRRPTVSYLSPHIGSVAYDVVRRKGYIDESYEDDDYSSPVIETPLWTKDELEQFVTIQYLLCVVNEKKLLWPIKFFAQEWGGFFVKQRHNLLFYLISKYKKIKAFIEGRQQTMKVS